MPPRNPLFDDPGFRPNPPPGEPVPAVGEGLLWLCATVLDAVTLGISSLLIGVVYVVVRALRRRRHHA